LNKSNLNKSLSKEEEQVMSIWEKVLGVSDIPIDARFLSVGGNSITATELFEELQKISKGQLEISRLFELDTIQKQAELLRSLE